MDEIESDNKKFDEKGLVLDSDSRQGKTMPNGVNAVPQ
jgi:hypothetical protein